MASISDRHGGDLAAEATELGVEPPAAGTLDFSVNLNFLGPPAEVAAEIAAFDAFDAAPYPDPSAETAEAALAAAHGISRDEVVIGPGATALFSWIISAFSPSSAHGVEPCYTGYAEIASIHGVPFAPLARLSPGDGFALDLGSLDFPSSGMVFLGSPNNPNGLPSPPNAVLDAALANPEVFFVVDESFVDFLPEEASLFRAETLPANVAVVKSLTKFFSIAGLRLGVLRSPRAAEIAARRPPWSVNALALRIAPLLYADSAFLDESREGIRASRESFADGLAEIDGIHPFPSESNFILCESRGRIGGSELSARLLERGFLIRRCSSWQGLGDGFIRLAVREPKDNEALLDAMSEVLSGKRVGSAAPRRCADIRIMVVGTSSGSGKSALAAGLCRLFARRGLKTAPFKAQNMSLNSYVTPEGGEIGRAQAMQAEAAGVEPHTDMNPVLLKPEGNNRSQIILDGKVAFVSDAKGYYSKKREVREVAWRAFDRLAERFDAVILEGAGSPAEINLMREDFVNMAMAERAEARAILVADIDRGGVFASILGTVKLLPPRHRRLLGGIVINKFRGDVSLLDSGIERVEALTGIPVLGVLPFIPDLPLDEEDSLSLDSPRRSGRGGIRMAVVRLPRISNFTDFTPLERLDGVVLDYATNPEAAASADLIILPGTKNTIADLEWLRESGLAAEIAAAAERGTPIIGICGGYQMLGAEIADPDGVEGPPRSAPALGLLPHRTVLRKSKRLTRVSGTTTDTCPFAPLGTPFEGYEIHVGESTFPEGLELGALLETASEDDREALRAEGAVSAAGNVVGTYVHGLFDSAEIAEGVAAWALERRGPATVGSGAAPTVDRRMDKDAAFDLLADLLEPAVRCFGIDCGGRNGASTPRARGAASS